MIQGQRIKLVAYEPSHWVYLDKWMSDPYYRFYFRNIPDVMSIAQTQNFPQLMNMNIFMIINEENVVVGMCTWDNIRLLARSCCIGFIIDKEFKGKGYAKDAFMEFLNYLTQRLGIHKVVAKIAYTEYETASKAEYGGFTDKVVMRDEFYMDGKWCDEVWLSVLDVEFKDIYEIYKRGELIRKE